MICALTVRKLKPGSFDRFREAFMASADPERLPEGWLRFNMLRNAEDPDEVICFGFFETDVSGMRAKAAQMGYAEQQAAIAPFVESVGADGLYEIVEDHTP
jgi:heme-degrading monooxygenase HmoA